MPRISVILPVFNAAATLPRALASIRAQTVRDWEIIAVDDGSDDESRGILEHFAGGEARMKVVALDTHRGVVAAHEAGLRAACGEVVARMDADDWSAPRRFERQLAMLDAAPSLGAVSCRVRLLDALGDGMRRYVDWANSLLSPEDIAAQRFVEAPVIHPSAMIRRDWIERIGGYRDAGWPEDYDLWLRLLEAGCRMAKVDETLFHWQDGPARLTRRHPDYAEDAVWRMKAHHLARLPQAREHGAALCGAGPIGRRLAGFLQAEGVGVRAIFDVDPRKIGRRVKGVEVLGHGEFGRRAREAMLISCVGVPGGRERVRDLARGAGYREGGDFWCAC